MISHCVREWEHLPVGESSERAVPRALANRLVASARAVGAPNGLADAILIDRHRSLQAQQVVGVLAANDVRLEILPKIDALDHGSTRRNLVHMIATAYDLKLSEGDIAQLDVQRLDLLEVVIRLFCERLVEAMRRGLPRQYVDTSGDLGVLRGRLDLRRQFSVLLASPQKVACRYQELSPDIPLNQIMRAAVSKLVRIARSSENQRRLAELALALSDITPVPANRLRWEEVVLDRTNSAWRGLLNFARLILTPRYQTTSMGAFDGLSIMFEMNTLFEEYIGRTMRRAFMGADLQVHLQGPPDHTLSELDGTLRFATRPDIVVEQGGERLAIVDTKWKSLKATGDDARRGVSQSDIYQMMAYARVYNCNQLILLYPHHQGLGEGPGRLCTYKVNGAKDVSISIATVSLVDLRSVPKQLQSIVSVGPDMMPGSAALH